VDAAASDRAPFLAFEGVEGSGKSTQIGHLAAHFRSHEIPFLLTREPGGTPLGDALRDLLLTPTGSAIDGLTELYLLEASRRTHVHQVILPALTSGRAVICDRYGDSSVAYQGGGRGLGAALVEALNDQATDRLRPDLTILLDVPAEVGLVRVGRRSGPEDRMEREALVFHERVRQAYLDLASRRGDRYLLVDAARDEAAVFGDVLQGIAPLFPQLPTG